MSDQEEQVGRDEEQPIGEDQPQEAIREAIEEGYRSTPRSESIDEQVLAPEEGGGGQEGAFAGQRSEQTSQGLDLNTATEKELSKLYGIGPALAKRIVRYREEEGPFRQAAEITKVRGISQITYQALADQIGVGPVAGKEAGEVGLQGPEEAEEAPVPAAEATLPLEEAGELAEEPAMTTGEEAEEAVEEEAETVAVPLDAEVVEPPPPPAQRVKQAPPAAPRGAGWGRLLLMGLLSTLAGALLALLVLFLLNGGTLGFERATARAIDREVSLLEGQLSEFQTQLDTVRQRLGQFEELSRQLDETQAALEGTQAEVGSLQDRVGSLQSELEVTSQGLADVRQTLAGLSDDLTSVAENVTALEDQVATIDERLVELSEQVVTLRRAAARFDGFLLGLRQLLDETIPEAVSPQATEETPTHTLTPLPTPIEPSATPASQVTVIPLVTPTP